MGIADCGLKNWGLESEPFDYFPLIEGYRSVGQIVRGSVYLPPGALRLGNEPAERGDLS
jgi:hypothetical protein